MRVVLESVFAVFNRVIEDHGKVNPDDPYHPKIVLVEISKKEFLAAITEIHENLSGNHLYGLFKDAIQFYKGSLVVTKADMDALNDFTYDGWVNGKLTKDRKLDPHVGKIQFSEFASAKGSYIVYRGVCFQVAGTSSDSL